MSHDLKLPAGRVPHVHMDITNQERQTLGVALGHHLDAIRKVDRDTALEEKEILLLWEDIQITEHLNLNVASWAILSVALGHYLDRLEYRLPPLQKAEHAVATALKYRLRGGGSALL